MFLLLDVEVNGFTKSVVIFLKSAIPFSPYLKLFRFGLRMTMEVEAY